MKKIRFVRTSTLFMRILTTQLIICLTTAILVASKTSGQSIHELKISLDMKDASLVETFDAIEEQTSFRFFYKKEISKSADQIDIHANDESMAHVLGLISEQAVVSFHRINNTISVKKEKLASEAVIKIADHTISGTIADVETGELLVGATVQVKGTQVGTITDVNGEFTLNVTDGSETLVVSFIGYKNLELPIGNRTVFEVDLSPDTETLNEVVVIGYGSQTKDKFNGAVSKVEGEKLNNFSTANFEQALLGNIAGVQVFSNSKNPGENSVIQIRGLNTLTAGTNPLIVVDGNPLTEGTSLSSVNTNDIESISVLKGAASAAIYGSRASSGVIFITTKKGKEGDLKVTYDGYFGIQQRIDKFELTDAYETALFDYDARNYGYVSGGPGRSITDDNATRDANGGGKRSRIPTYLPDYVAGQPGLTNTDWMDAVFRNAKQQSHYVNLSGGSGKSSYSVSFGYLDQENIVIDSDYKRYTNNIRFNSEISERVRFGINSNLSLSDANPTGEAAWSRSRIGFRQQADPSYTVVLMQPYYPIKNPDGSYAIAAQLNDNNDNWDGPISENTVAQTVLTDYTQKQFRAFGNTYLEIEPIKDLTFKTLFGGDYNTSVEAYFGPSILGDYRTPVANNPTQASKYDIKRENFITENTLAYKKQLSVHTIEAMAGFSYQQELWNRTDLESTDFADDNIRNIGGATTIASSSNSSKWALESYFSRLQYDYDRRYSFSASWRRDGSSRFGANTKYGNFASLSAGWTLSNESFFPQNDLISFSKVRISWGQTGNNQIGDFSAIAKLNNDNYVIDGNLVSGLYINTAPNADLSWETNTALNYGLDLGFLEDRLQVTAEYYKTNTTDMLLDVPVPQQSGFSESLQNIGELENKGFELEVSGRGYSIGNLMIGFNANYSTNRNKVIALGNGQDQIIYSNLITFITKVGHPIAQFYNYDVTGVYTSQTEIDNDPVTPLAGTEVGDYIVRDANDDGVIDSDDRVMQGDYNPDFTYGFGINLNFKGFDLNAQFYGVEGRKVTDNMVYRSESGEGFFVPTKYYFDNYFNERNPEGFFRRPDFSSFSSAGRLTRSSDLAVLDGDYFRLRSLQIGYNLPENMTEYLKVEGMRIYFTGNNIFNITKFRGYNSDGLDTGSTERQTLSRGVIQSAGPLTRFVALGLNIKF